MTVRLACGCRVPGSSVVKRDFSDYPRSAIQRGTRESDMNGSTPIPRRSVRSWSSLAGALASLLLFALRAAGHPADQTCPLPFAAIAQHHPIDDSCQPAGNAQNPAQEAQNRAKNNFCASGDPATVTVVSFRKLQAAATTAGVSFGSDPQLPTDRS